MKTTTRFALLILCLILALQPTFALENNNAAASRVRIGVDIRLGFKSCINSWSPLTKYLSEAIPDHRFVVVPLASRQDIDRTLEQDDVDFLVLDPAMEIPANDLNGATPLLTMTEILSGEKVSRPAYAASSGTLIRLAKRSDIATVKDLREKRLSAVKPWSLTGWIAQWGLLKKNGIDPHGNLQQVVFEGTNGKVVESVLDGSADVGAVDSEMLRLLIRGKKVDAKSLFFIDRKGQAVPMDMNESIASTAAYPGRVLSKAEGTSDKLAAQVVAALLKQSVSTSADNVPYQVSWTIARNYGRVRQLLRSLMGPDYAESPGFPLPWEYPAWVFHAVIVGITLGCFAIAALILRYLYGKRENELLGQVDNLRQELLESRAERQRIDAILALAGCGIDIVDDENRIVFADSGVEREYGDWHGQKCHEYYCHSETPCAECRRPAPSDEQRQVFLDINGSEPIPSCDPHAKVHYINGQSTRMIGIPYRDEGGRWLYARVHFPLEAFAELTAR